MEHVISSVSTRVLDFTVHDSQQWFSYATITIPSMLVDSLYNEALISQQAASSAHGFSKHGAPLDYIAQHYKHSLLDHLKEFLFKYLVINYLYEQIRIHKLPVVGEPRLSDVTIEPHRDATYRFELSLFPLLQLQEWKYLPFKAPKRKNYKDLDRQVESFIAEEQGYRNAYGSADIKIGDWVYFSLQVLNERKEPVIGQLKSMFWIRIGDEEVDRTFADLFLHKKVGDSFCTSNRSLQDYFSDPLTTSYAFCIEILDVVPYAYFCFDLFKHQFKLKTNKELCQKFIEVYSYRNDLSLRHSMSEESLKLLLSRHQFSVPSYLVLRQQGALMERIQHNPDYRVYRMQKDFMERVQELAYKQTQEQIFIDQLAYDEGIQVSHQDVKSYLNLTKRPRTKEFIYFDPPMTKLNGQEVPLHTSEIMRTCLREKTLNHIIYHLTKK